MKAPSFNYWILILSAFLIRILLLTTIQVNATPLFQKPILLDSNSNNKDTSLEWITSFKYVQEHVMENPAPFKNKLKNNESKQRSNAFVPQSQIVKRYKSDEKWVVLFKNNAYNRVGYGNGYWVAISYNKGKNWNYYYTGITENYPYVFKQNSTLPLLKNDSILEIECVKVHKEVMEGMLPLLSNTTIIKDSVFISINLNQIIKDSDNDGITDIVECRFLLNPYNTDTDGDGIPDGIDGNPRFKSKKTETGMLYQLLLEWNINKEIDITKYCFECNNVKQYSSESYPIGIDVFVTDNPDKQQMFLQKEQIILVSSVEYKDMIKRDIQNNCISLGSDKKQEKDKKSVEYQLRLGDTLFYIIKVTKKKNKWKFKLINWYVV